MPPAARTRFPAISTPDGPPPTTTTRGDTPAACRRRTRSANSGSRETGLAVGRSPWDQRHRERRRNAASHRNARDIPWKPGAGRLNRSGPRVHPDDLVTDKRTTRLLHHRSDGDARRPGSRESSEYRGHHTGIEEVLLRVDHRNGGAGASKLPEVMDQAEMGVAGPDKHDPGGFCIHDPPRVVPGGSNGKSGRWHIGPHGTHPRRRTPGAVSRCDGRRYTESMTSIDLQARLAASRVRRGDPRSRPDRCRHRRPRSPSCDDRGAHGRRPHRLSA